jgi:DNA-binding LytR/AlgR family response regulator
MEPIKILIVEDEMIIAEDIKAMLVQKYVVTGIALNYEEAIESIAARMPDLVMIDINLLGKKSGIDLAQYINDHLGVPFIFATSLGDEDTIERAKQTHPYAYLIKPFEKQNLFSSIEIALSNAKSQSFLNHKPSSPALKNVFEDVIFVKKDYYFIKIKAEDIDYVKADGNYLDVYCKGEKYIIRETLKSFSEQLNTSTFLQVHKSYIINLKKISAIANTSILIDQKEIPLSSIGKNELLQAIKKFS